MADKGDAELSAPLKLTIQDLPNEMLLSILKWIDDDLDLEHVQQVCPLWHLITDECLGLEVVWTSRTNFRDSHTRKKYPKRTVAKVGIQKLTINFPTIPSHSPSLKFPHLLRSLDLLSAPHPDIFANLLLGGEDDVVILNNLETFRFTHYALKHVNSGDLEKLHRNLPKLRNLIGGWEGFNGFESLPKLNVLFRDNHFPRLNHLAIDFPLKSFQDLETLRLLLRFVQAHSGLEKLFVTLAPGPIHPSVKATTTTSPSSTLESILAELNKVKSHRGCSLKVMNMTAESVSLRPGESNPQLDLIKRILLWPSSLQELYLDMELISNELLQALCSRNGATLKKVIINQSNTSPVEKLDLRVFSPLKKNPGKLSLYLFGNQEVSGAVHLPPNLECLYLDGTMRGDDIAHILLDLPSLQAVSLRIRDSDQEDFGITLDTLQRFVKNRRVKRMRIFSERFSSPDSNSSYGARFNVLPARGLSNGDPKRSVRLTCEHGFLEVELNKRGYYEQSCWC